MTTCPTCQKQFDKGEDKANETALRMHILMVHKRGNVPRVPKPRGRPPKNSHELVRVEPAHVIKQEIAASVKQISYILGWSAETFITKAVECLLTQIDKEGMEEYAMRQYRSEMRRRYSETKPKAERKKVTNPGPPPLPAPLQIHEARPEPPSRAPESPDPLANPRMDESIP